MREAGLTADEEPFRKQYHCIFGWVAQTAYVGAQVAVAALAVNYLSEQGIGIDKPFASQLFSYCQITFTVGRYVNSYFDNKNPYRLRVPNKTVAELGFAGSLEWYS